MVPHPHYNYTTSSHGSLLSNISKFADKFKPKTKPASYKRLRNRCRIKITLICRKCTIFGVFVWSLKRSLILLYQVYDTIKVNASYGPLTNGKCDHQQSYALILNMFNLFSSYTIFRHYHL